jgi:hypothetical protein
MSYANQPQIWAATIMDIQIRTFPQISNDISANFLDLLNPAQINTTCTLIDHRSTTTKRKRRRNGRIGT